jgi:hypothetical protein
MLRTRVPSHGSAAETGIELPLHWDVLPLSMRLRAMPSLNGRVLHAKMMFALKSMAAISRQA